MAAILLFSLGYVVFVFVVMAVPAALGFSFGIRNFYVAVLLRVFEVRANDFSAVVELAGSMAIWRSSYCCVSVYRLTK